MQLPEISLDDNTMYQVTTAGHLGMKIAVFDAKHVMVYCYWPKPNKMLASNEEVIKMLTIIREAAQASRQSWELQRIITKEKA